MLKESFKKKMDMLINKRNEDRKNSNYTGKHITFINTSCM